MEGFNQQNLAAASLITDEEAAQFTADNLFAIKYLMGAISVFRKTNNDSSVDWECDLGSMLFGVRGQDMQEAERV